MELFQSRVDQLTRIWIDLGLIKSSTKERPEWTRLKLKPALDVLDNLIRTEDFQRQLLAAKLVDVKASIEGKCCLLGRNADLYIGHEYASYKAMCSSYLQLCETDEALGQEVYHNKAFLQHHYELLKALAMELRIPEKIPALRLEDYSNATVILCRTLVQELRQIKEDRVKTFNIAVGNLYEVWETLRFPPTDPIEEQLVALFTNTQSSTEISVLEEHNWYSSELQDPLNLTIESLELLKLKQLQYCVDFNERKQHRERIASYILRLYNDLEVPTSEQKTFKRGFDEETISEMVQELNHLRQSLLASLDSIIEEYRSKLFELWEKCQVNQDERDRTIERILEGADKVERGEILQVELAKLSQMYDKGLKIFETMKERKELIQKMIDFERTASDPKRLFRSSFQLNEEERWRKTAYPNLLKFEEQLIEAIMIYESEENVPFMHNGARYLETLQQEIADRPVNLSVFGFVNGQATKPRSAANSASSSLNNSPFSSIRIPLECVENDRDTSNKYKRQGDSIESTLNVRTT
ncbi:hypothetical protein K493DRAFT_408158 [Basidiobolus meristosporus CBS 931.73]|uniref:Uncharacterized protein n=1 Tax=Basidiobolus meristosporus CBS 931.73 TaxID=1314790 RepID=A0A1Y1Y7Q1_9FUNG|nr:hypothetical protein K493DRAFT_408158 [Basidiobolus meristosporus CBS 931.73]|eukprot:ORX93989.1 hypothetical protein K493DRAFT_408158 [Basidiobolus meristosporus CBS 931.73]